MAVGGLELSVAGAGINSDRGRISSGGSSSQDIQMKVQSVLI